MALKTQYLQNMSSGKYPRKSNTAWLQQRLQRATEPYCRAKFDFRRYRSMFSPKGGRRGGGPSWNDERSIATKIPCRFSLIFQESSSDISERTRMWCFSIFCGSVPAGMAVIWPPRQKKTSNVSEDSYFWRVNNLFFDNCTNLNWQTRTPGMTLIHCVYTGVSLRKYSINISNTCF